MENHLKQAETFLNCSGTEIEIKTSGIVTGFPFSNDELPHNKYKVTLRRGSKSYTYSFYDSYVNYRDKKTPTAYDALACLEKYPAGKDMWDFANENGYEIKSEKEYKRVKKIYNECNNQYNALYDLFGSYFMESLREIM